MKFVGYTKWVGGLSSQWKIIKVYHFLSGLWLSKLRQSFWLWKSLQDKLFPKRFENLTQTKPSLQIRSSRPGQIGLSKIWVRYESYLALDVWIFESLKTKNLNGNLLHQWKKSFRKQILLPKPDNTILKSSKNPTRIMKTSNTFEEQTQEKQIFNKTILFSPSNNWQEKCN